jgi:3-hydroxyacyl-[acyl-carrier-protein] dehydratase
VRYILIDRILTLEPGRRLTALKNVSLSDDLVAQYGGVSALPSSMVLEAMAQAAGLLAVATSPSVAQPVLAKVQPFTAVRAALAGDQIEIDAQLEELREEGACARVTAAIGGAPLAEATIYLALVRIEGPDAAGRVAEMRRRLEDTFPGWFSFGAPVEIGG